MVSTADTRRRAEVVRRSATVGLGVLAAVVVWVVTVPVLGHDLAVESWDGIGSLTVTAGLVVATSAVAGLAAWSLLAVLERLTAKARALWTAVAAAVLVLSLIMPVTAAVDTGAALALATMHVAVGVVLIPMLPRSPR